MYENDPIKNSQRSRAVISIVGGPIGSKICHVLITYKFENDRINNNGEKVVTSF